MEGLPIQRRELYDRQISTAKLSKMHGVRHAYAERRYAELTGWKAPNNGGPTSKELTPEQKRIDRAARLQTFEELGHGRRRARHRASLAGKGSNCNRVCLWDEMARTACLPVLGGEHGPPRT